MHRTSALGLCTVMGTAMGASGCIGNIGAQGQPPGQPPGTLGDGSIVGSRDGGTPVLPLERTIGPSPLRRLNRAEYNQTVRDLFGITGSPADSWPTDGASSGFDNDVAGQGPTADLIEQSMRSAETVATDAVARINALLPCAAETGGDAMACGRSFIDTFGRRAYRRPLTAEDRTRLERVLTWGMARGGLPVAIRLVITAMLQSPHFLYKPEFGTGVATGPTGADAGASATMVPLTDLELATRLSYALTGTSPDDALLTAAEQGALHTPEQLRTQADRLLDTPAGRRTLDRFFRQWLPFSRLAAMVKSPEVYPDFNEAMRSAMTEGLEAFVRHVVFDSPEGSVRELMSSNQAFVNRITAPLYGLTGSYTDTLQRVTVTEPRAGLLMQAGMMAALSDNYQSSPVARGHFIFTHMLCQTVPPPPANLPAAGVLPEPDPTRTTRERFAEHRSNPACAGCHVAIDPIGFAFENFDAIGRYRTTENGHAIDASGEATIGGAQVAFDGPLQYAQYMSRSELTRNCLAQTWFTYAFGRSTVNDDTGTIRAMAETLGDGTARIRTFLVQMTQRLAFTHRQVPRVEECAQ